ncbi:SRPBCC family protein [Candidatus Peribacteria bacterium]|nr:SRPBCC family protein [Candidatus Peribacteria bacterium]
MQYTLQRSTTIAAPLQQVMDTITDFATWAQWSPWAVIDPEQQVTLSGTPGQIGHRMEWEGRLSGKGQMTITHRSDAEMRVALQFWKPFKSQASSRFSLTEQGGQTEVTWQMQAHMPWFLFWMIPTMKSMVEMDFDQGLLMLRSLIETGKIESTITYEGLVDFTGFSVVGLQKTSPMDSIGEDMQGLFDRIGRDMGEAYFGRHWLALYPKVDMRHKRFTYTVAVSDEKLGGRSLGPDYVQQTLPSTKALKITHTGSYEFLGSAWSRGMMEVRAQKLRQHGAPFEYYVNSPHDTPEADLITEIYFPVRG